MDKSKIKIESSWGKVLNDEFEKPYFKDLSSFVHKEYSLKKSHSTSSVYPASKNVFRAFDLCPFKKVKVVILGQDPYHGVGQAIGLSFAVNEGIRLPPSLQNIFKEIESDISIKPSSSGDLSRWAKQGVLLLNATLTVSAQSPGSHQGKGWENFTDAIIEKLSKTRQNLVFILWGNYAKNKGVLIDRSKHLVIESPHPSPFSAYNGFFGSKPFSKTNQYLKDMGLKKIDWH